MAKSIVRENFDILDAPDAGSAALVLSGSQAVIEGAVFSNIAAATAFGSLAVMMFIYGQNRLATALEKVETEPLQDLDGGGIDKRHAGFIARCVDRSRGLGYALVSLGFTNDLLGGITANMPRMIAGIGVGLGGMACIASGSVLRPDPTEEELATLQAKVHLLE